MESKKTLGILIGFLAIALIVFMSISDFQSTGKVISNPQSAGNDVLKVGWMTTWAEGGITIEPLKNTDILEENNANVELVSFLYGPPMVEAALSKQIDVLFVGWVPAVSLMSKSDDWIIVSRLSYFPMELMAREGSGIQNIKDLQNRKIAVPYATGPYPVVIDSLKGNNLEPDSDVVIVNIKPSDLGLALQSGEVDAVAWAEPSLTVFKQNSLAYPIEEYEDISFIVISRSYAEANPKQVKNFLKAVKEAQYYTSQNKEQVFEWFAEDSSFDLDLIKSLKIIEPNFNTNSLEEVKLDISEFWIDETQKKIDFEYQEGIIDRRVVLRNRLNLDFLNN